MNDPEIGSLKARLKNERTLIFDLKVIPKAARSEVVGLLEDGVLKVKVAAVPEKGKANDEVCRLLAGYFGIAERNITIVSGHTSARKRIRVQASA
jgi:uncharacterized protein (TIGR00251 family)